MRNLTLRDFQGTMTMPLLGGDRGVEQTIVLIRQLVDDAVKDPFVNRKAIEILQAANVSSFDRKEKCRALYDWVARNFLYVEDPVGPFGPKETLRPVRALLDIRAGDCDDYTVCLAALCGTIGIPTRAVTIAADPMGPREFTHIYPEAEIFPGVWISLDAARPGASFGVAPTRAYRARIWSLTDASYRDLYGARMSSLNGYAILGNDNTAAQDISATGQAVANIIAAGKGSPFASFATAYSPLAPSAGYQAPAGYPGSGLTAAVSPALAWFVVIGLGLVALARSRR
jgi:hypothetical protein